MAVHASQRALGHEALALGTGPATRRGVVDLRCTSCLAVVSGVAGSSAGRR
ncbi:MAG: hypothetical protein JWQ32_3563, partial [Marmoricola sp.]|nr:hypothetical protein [Marmoricola sp.]